MAVLFLLLNGVNLAVNAGAIGFNLIVKQDLASIEF